MTRGEFRATLSDATPSSVTPLLLALSHDARGEWDKAHGIAQRSTMHPARGCMRIWTALL